MKHLLYGVGNRERIVASEVIGGKENMMEVFYRDESDTVRREYSLYTPCVYINDEDPIVSKLYDDTPRQKLLGNQFYNLRIDSDSYYNLYYLRKESENVFMPFRQSQWMLQSGNTQFKGMDFDDPLRLYWDIETLTSKGYDFTNPERDPITIIALWTNREDVFILALNDDGKTSPQENVYRCSSERILLQKFVDCVREIDPDILVAHNGFRFDFPFIMKRAEINDVPLQLGRDGSVPTTFTTSIKFAEKSDEYENVNIYGRHVLDTYFMAKRFDSVARELPGLGLEQCVKFLGKASDDRTYIEGDEIADVWRGEHPKWTRDDLIRYALDDVKETQILDREWGIGVFEQTKMFPFPLQDVARYGTGNKVESLFERAYYLYGWSIPTPDPKRSFSGGYANPFMYGYISEPSVYADISSMYPTLQELLGIQPPKDELNIYSDICKFLKRERIRNKELAISLFKEGNAVDGARINALQNEQKVILNTASYGWLGSPWTKWNYYDGAESITKHGQLVIKEFNRNVEKMGGKLIKTDTDGSLIIPPKEFQGSHEIELEFVKLIESKVNKWLVDELVK